jgi:hypothetical protein
VTGSKSLPKRVSDGEIAEWKTLPFAGPTNPSLGQHLEDFPLTGPNEKSYSLPVEIYPDLCESSAPEQSNPLISSK